MGLLLAAQAGAAAAAAFTPGYLVVYRVGDGTAAPSTTNGNAVFLDEYTPGGTLVQSIALPASGSNALTTQSANDVGLLNRSADRRCLTVTGVATAAGTAATGAQRAAAFVLPTGVLDTTVDAATTLVKFGSTAYLDDSIRSSISNNCSQVWVSGNRTNATYARGVYYIAKDGTGLSQLISGNAAQGLAIAGGQLYVSAGGGTGTVSALGSGLPTSGTQTPTSFSPGPAVNKNYRSIALLDLDTGVAGADTLYVANNSDGKLEKYYGSGTSWTAAGSIALTNVSGLTARNIGSAANPVVALYFTDTTTNSMRALIDRSGRTGTLAGTPAVLVTAATNTQIRGVAFVPESAPPVAAPDPATTAASSAVGTTGFTAQWSAPAAGETVAFYVVELSSDDFATVSQTYTVPGGTTSLTITGLSASTTYKFRVRSVNSVGGSTELQSSAVTTAALGNQPPTLTGLTNNASYPLTGGDVHEPLASTGLVFSVADTEDAAGSLGVAATSGNTAVLPNANLALAADGSGGWTLKVSTAGLATAGYANVTVTVTDSGGATASVLLKLAVSVRSAADIAGNTDPRWIGGRSDASDGIAIGTRYVLIGDDEPKNVINLYDRTTSGQPAKVFDISGDLGVNTGSDCEGISGSKCDGEADIEASTRVGNRGYWLGSHSNNKNGKIRPDRWRFFAYDIAGSDLATTLSVVGYYKHLRTDLLAWDHGSTHGLGADYFGLTASSADGLAPESGSRDGFSFEGMSTSPDDSRMWFAFRAPLVPAPGQPAVVSGSAAGRTHALIVQVGGYDALLQPGGGTAGSASIGVPIRLDLGGRGIRDIKKNAAGQYLIIAGPPGGANGTAPLDFRLYSWDGSYDASGLATHLQLRAAQLGSFTNPNYGGSAEGIVEVPASLTAGSAIDIIVDSGDVVFYGDGVGAKDLGDNSASVGTPVNVAIKKSRIDTVALGAVVSSDASLSALALSAGTLAFDSNTGSYTVALSNSVTAVSITPTATDPGAAILVNGSAVASGSASAAIPLNVGGNSVTVQVTAADGTTARSYVLTLNRAAATAPAAPTGVTVVQGTGQATVYFTAPADNGGSAITGYRVVAHPAAGPDVTADGPGSPITVTGLAGGVGYTFTVLAINAQGNSVPSAAAVAAAGGVQSVPTLSTWALLLLGLLLATVANPLRRRHGPQA